MFIMPIVPAKQGSYRTERVIREIKKNVMKIVRSGVIVIPSGRRSNYLNITVMCAEWNIL